MSKELVYVVWEECRGMGETMLAVFTDEERAKKMAGESSHYYWEEAPLNPTT